MKTIDYLCKSLAKVNTDIEDLSKCSRKLEIIYSEDTKRLALSVLNEAMHDLMRKQRRLEDRIELQVYRDREGET